MKNFKATITALITPFKNGQVDYSSLEKLIRDQVAKGVNGFVVNGTTAESPSLKSAEVEEIFSFVRKVVGKDFLLIVGTGSNSTEKTIQATQAAEKWGADAALVVVPYYNKPPQRGLYEHFAAVARSTKLPIILYNVPGRTITSLAVETIKKLSEIENIIGIKEATGNIDLARDIKKHTPQDFILLSGDDGTYVDFLMAGGHGVISVATHVIPAAMVQWKKWVDSGETQKAQADIEKYKKLIDLLFVEANPIPVKKAVQLLGLIGEAELRLPLVELEQGNTDTLKAEMQKMGVLRG